MIIKLTPDDPIDLDLTILLIKQREKLAAVLARHTFLHQEMRALSINPSGYFAAPKAMIREHEHLFNQLAAPKRSMTPEFLLEKLYNYVKENPGTKKTIIEIIKDFCDKERLLINASIATLERQQAKSGSDPIRAHFRAKIKRLRNDFIYLEWQALYNFITYLELLKGHKFKIDAFQEMHSETDEKLQSVPSI